MCSLQQLLHTVAVPRRVSVEECSSVSMQTLHSALTLWTYSVLKRLWVCPGGESSEEEMGSLRCLPTPGRCQKQNGLCPAATLDLILPFSFYTTDEILTAFLLHAQPCLPSFLEYTNSVIITAKTRKLRLTKVKWLAEGHTARKGESRVSDLDLAQSKVHALFSAFYQQLNMGISTLKGSFMYMYLSYTYM